MKILPPLIVACFLSFTACSNMQTSSAVEMENGAMPLGAFSVSLAVNDIHASRAFYEKLDFVEVGGNIEQNWLILQNGTTTIGLFQGMFDSNIMTFNPGWNHKQETPDGFKDVREIQRILKERGIQFTTEADSSTSGPASFILVDPDGNSIYFDQHVESPL